MASRIALVLVGLGLFGVTPVRAQEGGYTSLGKECRTLKSTESGAVLRCPSRAGWRVQVTDNGNVVALQMGSNGRMATVVQGHGLGQSLEWVDDMGAPIGAIVRVFLRNDDDPGKPQQQVLAIIRFDGEVACVAGVVDARATPKANDVAREGAYQTGGFACGSDEPQVRGRDTEAARRVLDMARAG